MSLLDSEFYRTCKKCWSDFKWSVNFQFKISARLQFVIESWILYWTETFNFSNNFCRLDLNDIWDHGNLVVCCKTSDFQSEDGFDAPRYDRRPAHILNQQFHTLPGKLPATEENVKNCSTFQSSEFDRPLVLMNTSTHGSWERVSTGRRANQHRGTGYAVAESRCCSSQGEKKMSLGLWEH